ncbi:MAG TPA: phosphotransferase [Streptosporangiaceae bacterium]|nr:phosphotransferase [Streptosporangiaceae bacterium]
MPASEAEDLARDRYGLNATATRLATEKDDTFRLEAEVTDPAGGKAIPGAGVAQRWILKVAHPAEPAAEIDFQTALLAHVARTEPALPVPRVAQDLQGHHWTMITDRAGQHRAVRLMTWCPGVPLDQLPSSPARRRATGELLARLRHATAGFAHPADSPVVAWDVQHLPALRPLLASIPDPGRRDQLARGLDRFALIEDQVAGLRRQVLHNDFNQSNLLADPDRPGGLTGIIDFGDATRTAIAIDVATALLNHLPREGGPVLAGDIFEDGRDVLRGYLSRADLTPVELRLIPHLVMARVVARALISTRRAAQFPDNAAYLLRNTEPGWAQLDWFLDHSLAEVTEWLA